MIKIVMMMTILLLLLLLMPMIPMGLSVEDKQP